MSGSVYGTIFKISTWGESHGAGVGVVVDGCPAGLPLNEEDIQKYLDRRKPGRGDMFVLYDNGLKAACVVTREGEGIYEIKNIATVPFFQRQGYGKRLIEFLFEHYQDKCTEMLVGTGDVSSTISFYEHCGFTISHRVENFFTDNYDHPIYEEGKLLTDMVYLKRTF